jgi:Icc-related predicted phosphoesterase
MIRVAAVGDVHYGVHPLPHFREAFSRVAGEADVFLIAGDLTRTGKIEEISAFVEDLSECRIPKVAVLGNHEYQSGLERRIVEVLEEAGVQVLEGGGVEMDVRGVKLGIAGLKGFGGGFIGACGAEFGEPEMKLFARHSREQGLLLHEALEQLDATYRIALTHFSPIEQTLTGEKREIFPFLGSYHLAEPIDAFGVDLAIHGHAHRGMEQGMTAGGVPVRNVAYPVIRVPYRVYSLEPRATPVVKGKAWETTPRSMSS